MDSQPTQQAAQRETQAAEPTTQVECPPTQGSAGGSLPSAFESCLHAEPPQEELGEYIARPLARCRACGSELHELKNYRKPRDHGRISFMCVERTCGRRWYLDFGEVVEMRQDG